MRTRYQGFTLVEWIALTFLVFTFTGTLTLIFAQNLYEYFKTSTPRCGVSCRDEIEHLQYLYILHQDEAKACLPAFSSCIELGDPPGGHSGGPTP